MKQEGIVIEHKSLAIFLGPKADLKKIALECVALANAQGGTIYGGFENNELQPPIHQAIDPTALNNIIKRIKGFTYNTAITHSDVLKHQNGGDYFEIIVHPSLNSIATTSDGKIALRSGEECIPIRSEDLTRLASEKNAFQWELITHKFKIADIDQKEILFFANEIRQSSRVKQLVKEKTNIEILEHYNLIMNGKVTNLGLLWLGFPQQRARISYPITIQYIVYDEMESKIRKTTYFDFELNPMHLLQKIEKDAIELTYSHEFLHGLFREDIRFYPQEIVRELLVNAIAHKSYTISGDIFIEVYVDRIEISNPGGLPFGITRENILHQRHRRNPHLMAVFHDMELMEGEGSGYDLIYEINSRLGKPFPRIESDFNTVKVIQEARILDESLVTLINFISTHHQLTQKEFITLGIIGRHKKIQATDLIKILQLDDDRFRNWIGKLVDQNIVIKRGTKKGTSYLINPAIISNAKLNLKPTLKTIEPHRLKALIEEDVKIHPVTKVSEIHARLEEIDIRDIRKCVYGLVSENILETTGGRKNRTYKLVKKK